MGAMYWLYALFARGGRALVIAITMLPLFYFMILSTPALVLWPLLSEKQRQAVRSMIKDLGQVTSDVLDSLSDIEPPDANGKRQTQELTSDTEQVPKLDTEASSDDTALSTHEHGPSKPERKRKRHRT